jgi:pimeloyl-ACP methyl ester carboxylesterase
MSTFVLVHGGGHGGWCYKKVKRHLEAAGHEVFAPTLAGMAERSRLLSPAIDLDHHISDVVDELFYWDLRDVILAGHSYGGMVITGAADRAADRVGKLVFLDAANPVDGQSLAALTGPMITDQLALSRIVDGTEMVMFPDDYDRMWQVQDYFGVSDPADRAWLKERLTAQPWKTFDQPLRLGNQEAFDAIPQFHVSCESTFKHREGSEVIQRAIAEDRLWRLDTGHDLMLTEPEALAAILLEIAAR